MTIIMVSGSYFTGCLKHEQHSSKMLVILEVFVM